MDTSLSWKEGCIPAERSTGYFMLHSPKISFYRQTNNSNSSEFTCMAGTKLCSLTSKNQSITDIPNPLCDIYNESYVLHVDENHKEGLVDYPKRIIRLPSGTACDLSDQVCFDQGKLVVWTFHECLWFQAFDQGPAEIWTVRKEPFLQFIAIKVGIHFYLLQVLKEKYSNCGHDLWITNNVEILAFLVTKPHSQNTTWNGNTLSKSNLTKVSDISNMFCEIDVGGEIDNLKKSENYFSKSYKNLKRYVIVILIFIVLLTLIQCTWKILKYCTIRREKNITQELEKSKMNSQNSRHHRNVENESINYEEILYRDSENALLKNSYSGNEQKGYVRENNLYTEENSTI